MTRFWITLEKAGCFTVDILDVMDGGEIFIPKMPRENLMELAKQIAPNAKIKIVGRRKGEKLNELLLAEGERKGLKMFDDYFIIK